MWGAVFGFLFGLPRWVKLSALILAVAGIATLWLRYDARQDLLKELENRANKARIEHITGARETEDEIEDLSDADFESAIDGLPRADP